MLVTSFLRCSPAGYLRIFRLLWDIKHVDVVLERCWSAINATQRALNTLRGQERLHGVAVDNAELVCFATRASGWILRSGLLPGGPCAPPASPQTSVPSRA